MSELSLPSVWRQKSTDTMAKAAKQRSTLQEYRSAYWKFNSDTRRAQYSMQVQVNDSLKKKKSTLCLLIDQLSTTHQAAIPVLKTLEEIKGTLEKELEEKERLLARNAERLGIRAQRPAQELVADEPQRQLLAQEALLRDSVTQQQRVLKEVNETIEQLVAAQDEIKEDLSDKKTALDLNIKSESECETPQLKLPDINCKRMDMSVSGTLKLETDVTVNVQKPQEALMMSPNVWHGSTMKSVDRNRKIQTRGLQLCDGCEMLSKKLAEAILQAHHYVHQALTERLKELKSVKDELNEQHSLTLDEITEAETTSKMLQLAIDDIEEPLKISANRRSIHGSRPERELIEDDVQIHLKAEHGDLLEQEAYLHQRKKKVDDLLEELCGTRDELAHDIEMKNECINLDQKCLDLGSY